MGRDGEREIEARESDCIMDRRGRHPRRRPRRRPRRQPVSDPRDWAGLPALVLDLMSLKVSSLPDYLAFGHVCRRWYRAAKSNESRQISNFTAPRLLIPARSKFSLFNVFTKKVLGGQLDLPEKRYCGSSIGWMIYVEKNVEGRFEVTLIKPFDWSRGVRQDDNTIIRLPPLPSCLKSLLNMAVLQLRIILAWTIMSLRPQCQEIQSWIYITVLL